MSQPKLIALDADDYHAKYVGRTRDGTQFFMTNCFVPALDCPGREFLALYLFEDDGSLKEARISDLGTREAYDEDQAHRVFMERVREIGPITPGRIVVQPFALERFGTTFGFILRPSEDEEGEWWVEVEPGNFMAFHEPWDSGEYDT